MVTRTLFTLIRAFTLALVNGDGPTLPQKVLGDIPDIPLIPNFKNSPFDILVADTVLVLVPDATTVSPDGKTYELNGPAAYNLNLSFTTTA